MFIIGSVSAMLAGVMFSSWRNGGGGGVAA